MKTWTLELHKPSIRAISDFLMDRGYVTSVVKEDYTRAIDDEDMVSVTYEVPTEYSESQTARIILEFWWYQMHQPVFTDC